MSPWPDDNQPRYIVQTLTPINGAKHGRTLVLDRAYNHQRIREFTNGTHQHQQALELAATLNTADDAEETT